MACEDKQAAFAAAMQDATKKLRDGLGQIATEAERKATTLTQQFEQGNDLAKGVGVTAGSVVGGMLGGSVGAALGSEVGKQIGSLFVLNVGTQNFKFALDLPQVRMQTQAFSFDSPVIVMQDRDMSFDLPEIRMVSRRGPDKPETVCKMETRDLGLGIKAEIPVCFIKLTPTYFDFPEVTMKTQRIVIGLPVVSMVTQSFKLDIPEFKMERQELSFDIPTISLKFIQDAGKETSAAAVAIAQEAQAFSLQKKASMREELRFQVVGPCTAMFDCYRAELDGSRRQVLAMFDPQIEQVTESIRSILARNVPDTSPEIISLRQTLENVVNQRNKALSGIDDAVSKVSQAANEALDQFINHDPEEEAAAAAA